MFHHVKLFIWCVLVHHYYAARLPLSPCPNVFTYEEEPQLDRWYGLITFASNSELTGLDLKIQLDRPSQLLVSWDGDVRTKDNINYIIRNPFHTQRVGEMVRSRIMVKYYTPGGPPNVVRIDINSKTLCSANSNPGIGLSGESTTGRFDPSFSDNDNFDYNNNRGSSSANRPNYDFNGNVNQPSYSNNNNERPAYNGNSEPSYNHHSPTYNFPEYSSTSGSNSPTYNQNTGSIRPNDYDSSNSAFGSSGFNGGEPGYSGSNRPQTPISNGNGFSNQQTVSSGGSVPIDSSANGPVVTTLTLPTNMQNKTNIDQIVQIIKNQLEQQQLTANQGNKTVIVAVVNPNPTSTSSQINNVSSEQPVVNSVKSSSNNSASKKINTTVKPAVKPSSSHRNINED